MNLFPNKRKNWEQIYRSMESQQERLTRCAVLSLSPAVVETIVTDALVAGEDNELHTMTVDIGGFGIDVCRILVGNKYKVMCAGFEYSTDRKTLEQFMQALNVPFIFASAEGKMRSVVRILSKKDAPTTVLSETGWKVGADALEELEQRKKRTLGGLKPNEILVVGGSVPAGVPDTVYRDWIRDAKAAGLRTVLCAEGKLLKEGLSAQPTAVVLTRQALAQHLKKEVTELTLGADAMQIAARGIQIVCVYDEEYNLRIVYDGAVVADKVGKSVPMNRLGDESSIVAGLVMAMVQGKASRAMCYVTAVLNGTLSKPGNQMCTGVEFEKYFRET